MVPVMHMLKQCTWCKWCKAVVRKNNFEAYPCCRGQCAKQSHMCMKRGEALLHALARQGQARDGIRVSKQGPAKGYASDRGKGRQGMVCGKGLAREGLPLPGKRTLGHVVAAWHGCISEALRLEGHHTLVQSLRTE